MEKMFLIFTLFTILICISSFSWASSNSLIVDTSVCGSSLGVIDCITDIDNNFVVDTESLTNCLMYMTSYNGNTYVDIFFADYPFGYDSNRNVITAQFGCVGLEYSNSTGQVTGTMGFGEENYLTDFCYSYNNSDNYNVVSNYIAYDFDYTGDSFEDEDTIINTTFFENAFNYGGENGGENGGESGGESGGEDNGGILNFLTNFWSNLGTNLLHIVVPNSEDWSELQDSFEDDILDKFNITSMSFNDDLQYDWRSNNIFRKQCSYCYIWTIW